MSEVDIPQPIKSRPHSIAVREEFTGIVEDAEQYPYHVATYGFKCGAGYRIFVNQTHYDLRRQFQSYVKDMLEYVHKNGGPHPDVIGIPMEAEFQP
jgi:hypothetical protein